MVRSDFDGLVEIREGLVGIRRFNAPQLLRNANGCDAKGRGFQDVPSADVAVDAVVPKHPAVKC